MPGVADEVAPDVPPRTTRFHLWNVLLVVLTGTFVTVLVVLTGDMQAYWPLYLVPIVIASLAYHVGGAVITSAIAVALLALLMPAAGLAQEAFPQLAVGMLTFVLSGAVIGSQARRQRRHSLELEQTSIRDRLTGLYKGEYFHTRLSEELKRSDRYGVAVSVVLVSVADFDGFKERYGRYKAELLLDHLADVLRIAVRDTDIVARYTETSFAVILPFSGEREARLVAGRIEAAAAEAEFEGDVLEPAAHIRVTTAHASYPDEAVEQGELLRRSEERLGEATFAQRGTGTDAGAPLVSGEVARS
ncbi:MAG: hypothetical protein Kow0067_01950 [Coriobacteriia bacterium]